MKKKAAITLIIIALVCAVLFACKEEHSHQFGDWQYDENYHWKQCSCGDTADYDTHNYGNDGVCTDCKYKKSQIPSHTHSFDKRGFNSEYHWLECSCGDKIDYERHDENEWSCPTCNYRLYTKDLIYELNEDGLSYSVIGVESKDHTSIVIPPSYDDKPVTRVKYDAFKDCPAITSITIPDTIKSFGHVFGYTTNLSKVNYLGDLTGWLELTYRGFISIAYDLYFNDELVTDVVLPEGITSLEGRAFDYCKSLTSITIPSSVTYIGYYFFPPDLNLTKVNIIDLAAWCNIDYAYDDEKWHSSPNPLRNENAKLYLNDELVTELVIPDSVTAIKKYAFDGCSNITSVIIPESITMLGDDVFRGCSNLKNISLPNSLISLRDTTFSGCPNIEYNEYDNALYLGNSANPYLVLVRAKDEMINSIAFPHSTKIIADYAFYYCENLNKVALPTGIKYIGNAAFYYCSSLTDINIPNSVTRIGYGAFEYCYNLTDIDIPDGVTEIGPSTFSYCYNLTNIDIPDSVTYIGYYAFDSCSNLTNVNIPDSVTYIGSYAFSHCTNLTKINIPNSVNTIGSNVFRGCENLTDIIYDGTIAEWNNIEKYQYWNENMGDYTITCSDGVITKNGGIIY